MVAWFENSPKSLLILSEISENHRLTWHSAERQSLGTFGPFVLGALGFDLELRDTKLIGAWDTNPLSLVGTKLDRISDILAGRERRQLLLSSQFRHEGLERVEIYGVSYDLERVSERVSAEGRHRFTNLYWVDKNDGRTWKSRQTIVPTLPQLNTEVMKYAAI